MLVGRPLIPTLFNKEITSFFIFSMVVLLSTTCLIHKLHRSLDEFIFTALYPIDMHIDIRNLTGKVPYGPIFYLDDEYNSEN